MQDPITKFGDRCSFMDPQKMETAWRRYKKHLVSCGITDDEPVYKYFVYERFHDSELRVERFDVANKVLDLSLFDIMLMDEVGGQLDHKKLDRDDFLTGIRFVDVKAFRLDIDGLSGTIEHCLSEIDRSGEITQLTMHLRGQNMNDRPGMLEVSYKEIVIEDIGSRISAKYFGGIK